MSEICWRLAEESEARFLRGEEASIAGNCGHYVRPLGKPAYLQALKGRLKARQMDGFPVTGPTSYHLNAN